MLNKKGFTLTEMIVSIAIFAIAGLILTTGFSTVIRYMSDANIIRDTNEQVFMTLEKEESTMAPTKANVTITMEDDSTIKGIVNQTTSSQAIDDAEDAYVVKLSKFQKGNEWIDPTLTIYEQMLKAMKEWGAMSEVERQNSFKEAKEKLEAEGFTVNYRYLTGLSNDNFRWFYYIKTASGQNFPTLDKEIVEQANKIYDSINPSYPKSSVRIGDNTLYIKPYYMPELHAIVLTAEKAPTSSTQDGWRCRLFFNPDDLSWYYKVFKATNNLEVADSYISISDLRTAGPTEWKAMQQQLKDASKWRKIKVEK